MLLDFPFLWPQQEEVMWQILDGPLGQELLQALEAKPWASAWSSGFKHVTTSQKPTHARRFHRAQDARDPVAAAVGPVRGGASPTPVDFRSCIRPWSRGWWMARRTRRDDPRSAAL